MRLIGWILLFPVVLIAVSFAVSNRDAIGLTLWPLPFAMELPLVLFGFLMVLSGFIAGGFASWVAGHHKRKHARENRKRISILEKEIQALEKKLNTAHKTTKEAQVFTLPPVLEKTTLPTDSKQAAHNSP